jgi:hypothetical protein
MRAESLPSDPGDIWEQWVGARTLNEIPLVGMLRRLVLLQIE